MATAPGAAGTSLLNQDIRQGIIFPEPWQERKVFNIVLLKSIGVLGSFLFIVYPKRKSLFCRLYRTGPARFQPVLRFCLRKYFFCVYVFLQQIKTALVLALNLKTYTP